jgi:hypothetical protein
MIVGTFNASKRLHCEQGQASIEYLIAIFVGLVIFCALAGLYMYFSTAGERRESHSGQTYLRAPYTLPFQGAGSEQWLKDLIVH